MPHYAMSGGTLIALAADEIVICEHAVLGPVDPQLGQYPAASIIRVARRKPIAEIDVQTLIWPIKPKKPWRWMIQLLRCDGLRFDENTRGMLYHQCRGFPNVMRRVQFWPPP